MKTCFNSKILNLSSTFKMNLQCLKLAVELNLIISISKTSITLNIQKNDAKPLYKKILQNMDTIQESDK